MISKHTCRPRRVNKHRHIYVNYSICGYYTTEQFVESVVWGRPPGAHGSREPGRF